MFLARNIESEYLFSVRKIGDAIFCFHIFYLYTIISVYVCVTHDTPTDMNACGNSEIDANKSGKYDILLVSASFKKLSRSIRDILLANKLCFHFLFIFSAQMNYADAE